METAFQMHLHAGKSSLLRSLHPGAGYRAPEGGAAPEGGEAPEGGAAPEGGEALVHNPYQFDQHANL